MALSGSTNFSLNATQIVTEALQILGSGVEGEGVDGDELNKAIRRLNMVLKHLTNKGLHYIIRKSKSITMVAADYDYILAESGGDVTMAKPDEILRADLKHITNLTIDQQLTRMSHDEYYGLPSRLTDTGIPTSYFINDTGILSSTLYLWPIPDATTVAAYTLELQYLKPYDDIDSPTDDIELDSSWYLAIAYQLAYWLSADYGYNVQDRGFLRADAKTLLDEAMSTNIEGSIKLRPSRSR